MIGARKNGVDGLGVLWGYGSESELMAAGACACAARPGQIADWLANRPGRPPRKQFLRDTRPAVR